jgi:hypothetical protein
MARRSNKRRPTAEPNHDAVASRCFGGAQPEAVAGLFDAAAGLFHAAPWTLMPGDDLEIAANWDGADTEAVVAVFGEHGEGAGFVIFDSLSDFGCYIECTDAAEEDEPLVGMPRSTLLSYVPIGKTPKSLLDEATRHGWHVPSGGEFPLVMIVEPSESITDPTSAQLALAEATARALTALAEDPGFARAWESGPPVERTVTVNAPSGSVSVTLRAPCYPMANAANVADDLLRAILEDPDAERREELGGEVLRRFYDSPEAKALEERGYAELIVEYADHYRGLTVATLSPLGLREVVFRLIPAKVSIDPSAARPIIEETLALYHFLERALGLPQAAACRAALGHDAVARLEAELSDPLNFGMAKALFMTGGAAGFDMTSAEGVEQ